MQLEHIAPHPLLKGYIEKLWVFESNGQSLHDDLKLIVPNGLIKLILPFHNGVSGKMDGWFHLSQEHSITLIGITDIPAVVQPQRDCALSTIGVELSPLGAYRFFNLRYIDIKNQIHPLTDILGQTARELQEKISSAVSIAGKLFLLQEFFIQQFLRNKNRENPIFDYCIRKIKSSNGNASIKALEKETGYSSRWLNTLFANHVGISPKNLSVITRFQPYYQSWANHVEIPFEQREYYVDYYDQSHFIKEFKRFTGLLPSSRKKVVNNFGNIFYKE